MITQMDIRRCGKLSDVTFGEEVYPHPIVVSSLWVHKSDSILRSVSVYPLHSVVQLRRDCGNGKIMGVAEEGVGENNRKQK